MSKATIARDPQAGVGSLDCSALWVIAIVMTKTTPTGLVFTQTVSWRRGMSEDEARGSAIKFAMQKRPDYAVGMVTITQIPSPNISVSGHHPAAGKPQKQTANG